MTGHASWYGDEFARRPTASGERYDPAKLTGAHRTLPFGSRVRVTNLQNGRSVLVIINDRGPYAGRRAIDLSYGAARALGMVERGVTRVRIELVES
jgi:rare lipoprotein A